MKTNKSEPNKKLMTSKKGIHSDYVKNKEE
jgi:hypothetical protein